MAGACTCGGRLGATGIDNCVIQFLTTSNFILMPLTKADGTKNFIDLSSATLGADILALTSVATAQDERIYPLPYSENVTREKAERLTESAPSGNIYNIQDGLRSNHMEFWGKNASFRFLSELEKFGCTDLGFFSVDINGTLEGFVDDNEPTKFYPIPVMPNSYYAMYQYATDTTIQKLMLDFNVQRNFDESQIYYLTAADLGYPATYLKGLIPASIAVSNITTTGVTATVSKNGMSALTKKPLTGLILADFTLFDNTGAAAVTITGVTEGADGVYAITYAAVTGANEFTLSASATGYDIADVDYSDPA